MTITDRDITRLHLLLRDVEMAYWGPSLWHARSQLRRHVERCGHDLADMAGLGVRRRDAVAKHEASRKAKRAEAAKARRVQRLLAKYEAGKPMRPAEYEEAKAILLQRNEALSDLAKLDAALLDDPLPALAGSLA